jgi:hypothetical protein
MTIWGMHISHWVSKATNTHSEYVILLLFYCNTCTNAPQCYVKRTIPVFLVYKFILFFSALFNVAVSSCNFAVWMTD